MDWPRGRRLLLIALLTSALIGPTLVTADDERPGEMRFRWVEALEALHPREFPNRLSRPLASYGIAAVDSVPTGLAVDFAHYPSSADVVTFLAELEALYPHLVETYQVGESWRGRPIMGLRVGNETTGDPDLRPALYLDGQHHAREPISQQIVLYAVWNLLSGFGTDPLVTHLLNTRTVYAVPSVNVDGNDIWLAEDHTMRRTANPTSSDDDIDGLFDEDPANGMGYGTYQVYRYDFEQAWADAHPDDPFAPGWEAHHLGTEYLGVFDELGSEVPQLDDDEDMLTNEDPTGGVDANRNYDAFWHLGDADPRSPFYRGPTVWSEREPAAVRDFVSGHDHIVTALSYHSGADVILHPWGWSGDETLADALMYELLSRKGSQLTETNGFIGSPHAWAARGLYVAPGTAMDWLYSEGVYAWIPEAYAASSIAFTEREGSSGSYHVGISVGVGFNPDPADIPQTTERWNPFTLYILAATPNVEFTEVAADDGSLTLTMGNDGFIPVELTVTVMGESGLVATETIPYLQAAERVLSISYPSRPGAQSLAISVTASSLAGTMRREAETVNLSLWIVERGGPDAVWITQGNVSEFVDLGDSFGGWLAPGPWDTAEVYHLGPPLIHEAFVPLTCSH